MGIRIGSRHGHFAGVKLGLGLRWAGVSVG